MPLITPQVEEMLFPVVRNEAIHLGCEVLALGGLADHVHLALKVPAKRAPSELMQQIKGYSSAWARSHLRSRQSLSNEPFGWQDGYGVFSFSRSHRKLVIAYIENQAQHHAMGELWPAWEETDETVELT